MYTPEQLKRVTANLNSLAAMANEPVKIHFYHQLMWFDYFSNAGEELALIPVESDHPETYQALVHEVGYTDEDIAAWANEILMQVSIPERGDALLTPVNTK